MTENNETIAVERFYTEQDLKDIFDNTRTALPFDEDMGKRAGKARRRAARLAAERAAEETDCEIPTSAESTNSSPSRASKIPVLRKGNSSNARSSSSADEAKENSDNGRSSRIPRPVAKLIYLERHDFSSLSEDEEATSHTGDEMVSEISSTETIGGMKQVKIIGEANGVNIELDLSAFVGDQSLELAGFKIE